MNRSQKSQCRRIAERYGVKNQESQAVSELTELQYVLTRRVSQRGTAWEAEHKETWTDSLLDEIADVYVMLQQLQTLYEITDADVSRRIDYKLERQIDRMKVGE